MTELLKYIEDPSNDLNNFHLGSYYEKLGHYSPASAFYLRCSEKTKNIDLRYEALLRLYICYMSLGGREYTCETLLKLAISLCPQKPEAYFFLTQYYEFKTEWLNVYSYSCIALENCKDKSNFVIETDFPGMYALIFQKAISAWWIGKPQQSRDLFKLLLNEHIYDLNDRYKQLLENNLSSLGAGPEHIAIRRYDISLKDRYKFSFDGIYSIHQNFSQVYQDMFVLSCLNGKKNGTYLEIGSSDPYKNSNTALLETQFGWRGVGIEYNTELAMKHSGQRKNPVICTDALIIDYNKLLTKYFPNQNTIDYLQLDIEPPRNTYEALLAIPFDKYKFAVITYEHDYYVDITRSYRSKSRSYLENLGYKLIVPNISPNEDSPFEDWWIHPDLVDSKMYEKLAKTDILDTTPVEQYFLK